MNNFRKTNEKEIVNGKRKTNVSNTSLLMTMQDWKF